MELIAAYSEKYKKQVQNAALLVIKESGTYIVQFSSISVVI
jgi:hypothetical protein